MIVGTCLHGGEIVPEMVVLVVFFAQSYLYEDRFSNATLAVLLKSAGGSFWVGCLFE